jgi:catechol 2,3-dioxygenase-like lactoylglutathione lyase family enzyme
VDYKLELVIIPVTDIDRAADFYETKAPGHRPARESYGAFLSFSDPDGNGFLVQEVRPDGAAEDAA